MLSRSVASSEVSPWYQANAQPVGFRVTTADGNSVLFEDPGNFLFHLDKELTIALQYRRPDLFFLHGAAVALDGRVAILSAPSGTGKSTLTWALLEDGFGYLSDELAPVDMQHLLIHPYPHAVCLKSPPPAPYRLPSDTLDVGDRFHVPVESLHGTVHHEPLPLAALIFLQRHTSRATPVQSISASTAAAHLMSNALNGLAHPDAGLDAAITLARSVPCYELNSSDLRAACLAVRKILGETASNA